MYECVFNFTLNIVVLKKVHVYYIIPSWVTFYITFKSSSKYNTTNARLSGMQQLPPKSFLWCCWAWSHHSTRRLGHYLWGNSAHHNTTCNVSMMIPQLHRYGIYGVVHFQFFSHPRHTAAGCSWRNGWHL